MGNSEESGRYQIKIASGLDQTWSDWLGGMELTAESDEQGQTITVLTGRVADQAYLRGILSRIWDLNMRIISVRQIGPAKKKFVPSSSEIGEDL